MKRMTFTVGDVWGAYGIVPHKQRKLCEELGIDPKRDDSNQGKPKILYTEAQVNRLIEACGIFETVKDGEKILVKRVK